MTSFPMTYVLDADGVIRAKGRLEPVERDKLIEALVSEQEAKAATPPRP